MSIIHGTPGAALDRTVAALKAAYVASGTLRDGEALETLCLTFPVPEGTDYLGAAEDLTDEAIYAHDEFRTDCLPHSNALLAIAFELARRQ
jgi:hypothetical protein